MEEQTITLGEGVVFTGKKVGHVPAARISLLVGILAIAAANKSELTLLLMDDDDNRAITGVDLNDLCTQTRKKLDEPENPIGQMLAEMKQMAMTGLAEAAGVSVDEVLAFEQECKEQGLSGFELAQKIIAKFPNKQAGRSNSDGPWSGDLDVN